MSKDRNFYSLLFDFCQRQILDIDINKFHHSLGKLVFSAGEIYTLEDVDIENRKYKLIPFALSKENDLTRLTAKDIKLLSKLDGNDLEYIALNTRLFPILGDDYWEGWNPLDKPDGHKEIYQNILNTVNNYITKRGGVLVIGCGTGDFLEVLTEQGYEAKGIDSNKTNVKAAVSKGRKVLQRRIEELKLDSPVDVVIDPGVLSAGVVERDYVELVLPKISAMIKPKGYFIHAPFSRSLFSSEDLINSGLVICNRTIPANLFRYELPKQFYVAQKE